MTKAFVPFISIILGGFTALIGLQAQAQQKPANARIVNVQLVGSGCDANSTSVILSPDLTDMSVLFDNYGVEIGQGSTNPGLRTLQKDCRMIVDIQIPQGWSFAFDYVDYRGFAALPSGSWGFHRFSYITNLRDITSAKEVTINGPYNNVYSMRANQKPERLAWTPCNSSIQRIELLSQLAVNYLPKATTTTLAQMALDSADFSAKQSFGLKWKQCTAGSNPNPNNPGSPRPPGGIIRPRF